MGWWELILLRSKPTLQAGRAYGDYILMTFDLTRFDLGAMLKCSPRLRESATDATTLEQAAQRVCRFLYDELRAPDGDRACALVRCYKTHSFGGLEPDLKEFAQGIMGKEPAKAGMKCLTLLATVGQNPGWNSRHQSQGHRAIPLPSAEIVEKAPMIAQLIKEFGFDLTTVLQPQPDVVKELGGKRQGVFHVETALGSPYIPAQKEFVARYDIRSVLGFGGLLPNGDLFAVILFTTVPVPTSVAERFKTLALDLRSSFSKYGEGNIFEKARPSTLSALRPR